MPPWDLEALLGVLNASQQSLCWLLPPWDLEAPPSLYLIGMPLDMLVDCIHNVPQKHEHAQKDEAYTDKHVPAVPAPRSLHCHHTALQGELR